MEFSDSPDDSLNKVINALWEYLCANFPHVHKEDVVEVCQEIYEMGFNSNNNGVCNCGKVCSRKDKLKKMC